VAPTTEPTAELTVDAGPLPDRPAVSTLEMFPEGPGFGAATGFWSAAARPAMRTAKTNAAANAPHAYKQTLRARSKARERVADPSTANTLPLDDDNHAYLAYCRTAPGLLSGLAQGRLAA